MKFYIIYKNNLLCDIAECDVLKETPKTFIIKVDDYFIHTVRKETMQFGDLIPKKVFKTYEEAQIAQINLLKDKIETKTQKINSLQEDIKAIENFLKNKELK